MKSVFLLLCIFYTLSFASLKSEEKKFFYNDTNLTQKFFLFKNKSLLKKDFIPLDNSLYTDYDPLNINVNKQLDGPQKKVVKDTVYLQLTLITAIGVLAALPESVSKWDLNALEEKSLPERWKEHVKAGPVWDEDEFFINYVGHPVSGAWYYTMARNDGFDRFDSFLYSVFVSTFIWEYGYEAFAEIPSIQDLFSTPIIGSLMGEYMYYIEQQIDKNHGLVLNSKYLGNISYFFLDPLGNIADGIGGFLNMSVTMHFQTYQLYNTNNQLLYNRVLQKPAEFDQYDYGVIFDLSF